MPAPTNPEAADSPSNTAASMPSLPNTNAPPQHQGPGAPPHGPGANAGPMPPPPHHVGPPPPPGHGPPHGGPGDYYRYPPAPYYDPYYYDSYDYMRPPYGPPGHPGGPHGHGPPPGHHGPPPPRFSPEYRSRYAYPPPPGRPSPRSMYGRMPPPGVGPNGMPPTGPHAAGGGMNGPHGPSGTNGPPNIGSNSGTNPPPSRTAQNPDARRGPPPRVSDRPRPVRTLGDGSDPADGAASDGPPPPGTPSGNAARKPSTPIVSRGPSPDGSKAAVATASAVASGLLDALGAGVEIGPRTEPADAIEPDAGKSAESAEADKENCPGGGNAQSPKNEEFMDKAVDNIIAAAEQIEKRDTPPNCPKKPQDNNATTTASTADTNSAAASSTSAPTTGTTAADPNYSPPPPSFHRYSTSPEINRQPPMTHSMPHEMNLPCMPPPNGSMGPSGMHQNMAPPPNGMGPPGPGMPPSNMGPPGPGMPPNNMHPPGPGMPPNNMHPPGPGMPPNNMPPSGMMPPPGGPGGYGYDPYYDYRGPYDYYDQHYYPPPPYDDKGYDHYGPPPPHGPPHGPPSHGRPNHPPHCACAYCSPSKRRVPTYPPPYFDREYQEYSLSSPENNEPPSKKRRRNDSKRMYHTYSNATKHKSSARRLTPQEEEAEMDRVTRLAAEVEKDPNLYRAVLLHMALEKESPKKKPSFDVEEVLQVFSEPNGGGSMGGSPNSLEGFGGSSPHGFNVAPPDRGVIGEGFYWKDYPILENVLRKSMDEYYEMSENCPQSKQQQQFNNRLVSKVYHTAIHQGYTFDSVAFMGGSTPLTERKKVKTNDPGHEFEPLPPGFNYKKLRDRIRCYYKTHVQNSKKRLTTMLKNPTKPKNREILLRVVEEVKSEGYIGPLSGCWGETKPKKQKGSKVAPTVTFSSDDDFGLGSFSTDSASPTEAGRLLEESDHQQQAAASPFRRMEHAQILSSMRDQVSI